MLSPETSKNATHEALEYNLRSAKTWCISARHLFHAKYSANMLAYERVFGVNFATRIARALVQSTDVVKQERSVPQTMFSGVVGDVIAIVSAKCSPIIHCVDNDKTHTHLAWITSTTL